MHVATISIVEETFTYVYLRVFIRNSISNNRDNYIVGRMA